MTDNIEVLVHISTSATQQNDELFRSIANAYTVFEPHKTHRSQRKRRRAKVGRIAKLQPDSSPREATGILSQEAADVSLPTASRESYGSFPSYPSSEGVRQSVDRAQDDSVRPISRLAQLDQSYLSWRNRTPPYLSFRHIPEKAQSSSDGREDVDTGFIEDSQSALQALQSQLQDTWSMTSADSSMDDSEEEIDIDRPEKASKESSSAEDQPFRSPQDVPLPPIPKDHVHRESGAMSQRGPMDLSEITMSNPQSHPDTMLDQLDFSKLPTDAAPPPPPISVLSPVTLPSQITKHLAATKINNLNRFHPLKVRRSLAMDERGYWRIDSTTWPQAIQQDFWLTLHEHVCSGRLGWGITLHRESSLSRTLGLVRLYCWGEVVEHMWLLMSLCSHGKLSEVSSSWIDADGIAVVEMKRTISL